MQSDILAAGSIVHDQQSYCLQEERRNEQLWPDEANSTLNRSYKNQTHSHAVLHCPQEFELNNRLLAIIIIVQLSELNFKKYLLQPYSGHLRDDQNMLSELS